MSTHIEAKKGEIEEKVILPGDPMRAKFIAENFLTDVHCYNKVRGMYGFTGKYKNVPISIQGTGMGIPSISIYVNELIAEYGVKNLIRVGTCGGYSNKVKIKDLIIAMSACTDSNINITRFAGRTFAPTASFKLLKPAYEIAQKKGFDPKVGPIFTSDTFYNDTDDSWKIWAKFGCLGVEMETAGLYTLAAKYGVNALSLLTVSDHFITKEETSSQEREKTFTSMIETALETMINI
ncbi:purine-nucleoside phosphorylase [Clostridium sp. BJN0001]|uniref:purine-nucleoside phosphorylase n=1 Tax=Clostridium sp. BJN0001 TaxID=2930219 RepID=UPI001FD0C7D6|nr:purine-nucleoside phosphorylase [Clostridium sp. BJN0001]